MAKIKVVHLHEQVVIDLAILLAEQDEAEEAS